MRILVFGDSIGQGFWDVDGGWVSRIRHQYDKQIVQNRGEIKYPTVFNLGISGDLTQNVLDRIENEAKARELPGEECAIVLAIGINDSVLTENVAQMDVYEFQEQYEELVNKAKDISSRVLCVGLTAVDEVLANPWEGSTTGKQWLNNRINLFEDTIKQVAIQKDVQFVGLHDGFIKLLEQGQHLLNDGLHPNKKGHEIIAKVILPELNKLIS